MRFSPQFLDDLRDRLAVSDVVGRRVKLKKSGAEWRGLSPFNKERTPSFFVNDQKGMWFDFSAGRNGNIFDFVMLTEGVSFPEAVERLAEQAGVALPKFSPEEAAREQRRRSLGEVLELATRFFEANLAARTGAKARGYLGDRGIDPPTQLRFRLGYAMGERFALKEHLGKLGVSTEAMVEAGLLVSGEDIPLPYDRFRERVIFPITDLRDRVIAFGGRALDPDVPAKYLNSPETPLFHKGSTLYNIAAARAAAHKGVQLIAVEGYVDVIAMVQAGYEAAVAPLGTALTADQLLLLWRMADEPMLCFDGDDPGRRAAYRAIDLALPLLRPGKSLKFATLPQGQDPDDLLRAGGREAIAEVVGAARPLAHVLWTRELEAANLDTPERRAAFEARLGQAVAAIGDEAVRRHYRREFGERLRRMFESDKRQQRRPRLFGASARAGMQSGANRSGRRSAAELRTFGPGEAYAAASPQLESSPVHRGHRAAIPRREALMVQAVINHPWLLHDHLEEFARVELRHCDTIRVKAAVIDIFAQGNANDADVVMAGLDRRGLAETARRIRNVITTSSVWAVRPGAAPDDVLTTWKQLVALHHQDHLAKELKEAEHALGHETTEANYSRLQDVKAQQTAAEGTEALIEGFGALSGRSVGSL
jgi:DNA primase